jgi:FMN-dependent NADH-azoreductase
MKNLLNSLIVRDRFGLDSMQVTAKILAITSIVVIQRCYLFSLSTWNFGSPDKLKHYIDVIAQPGQSFSIDPATGYRGLVTGKPSAVVYAHGGAYGSAAAKGMDLKKGYMDLLLGFIGFKNIQSIMVEPTLASPTDVARIRDRFGAPLQPKSR